ncbi:hypothetical protein BDV24DRAFT_174357 [Aspergillus arachidicola]|uniref:Major facilitator superfamily (MFS) profile domain-containing protein n=1 Tax=Aspergillus arachidicola TaxID=656916 RepID=A0A2G7FZJ0_9EURO|nr:hypothetical protein BDV24DRAFT_174357 [Aspergillus arachidicola]PIG85977.1 hypothetical protein AARAC_011184 [Aspergillus arachidicola]
MEMERGSAAPSGVQPPPYTTFTTLQKRYIVLTASGASFFSGLSAQIYFPALNTLATDMGVSMALINLTLTSYMIFQGIAPIILGPVADQDGRRPAFIICFIIYIAANIGLAVQDNFVSLLLLRCMQSAGSSSTVAISSAVVADTTPKAERGSAMGLVLAVTFLGPAVGPVAGGLLSQYLGWRAIFWFLTVLAAIFFLTLLLFFPETARHVVGNGSGAPQKWNRPWIHYACGKPAAQEEDPQTPRSGVQHQDKRGRSRFEISSLFRSLYIMCEKASSILILANGVMLAGYMVVMAAIPPNFHRLYALNDLQIGLCYIPLGAGAMAASVFTGKILDAYYQRLRSRAIVSTTTYDLDTVNGDHDSVVPVAKARCTIALPFVTTGGLIILAFGWLLQFAVHLAVPVTLLFFLSLALTSAFNCASILLVDLNPASPAAATAASNLVRCLLAAGATALIDPMQQAMGCGWAFTVVALVVLATILPFILLIRMGK